MKLNLDYYKSDILYDKTISLEDENKVLEYINNYDKNDYYKIFETDPCTAVFTAFSENTVNLVNWYDFKEDSSILQVCGRFGEITGELCEKAKKVIVIEPNKKRAEAIAKRHSEYENLEIICANIEDVTFEEKFDYVLLSGVLENANSLILENNQNNKDELLIEKVKSFALEDGHVLISTNNKFGVKNFSGVIENVDEKPYDSISGNTSLYSKDELEELLKKTNLENYKFYYMLPDYKIANVIFSEDYIPNPNDTKIIYNKYCNEDSIFTFDELKLIKEVTKSGKFEFFCNSYFVDILVSNRIDKENLKCSPKFVSFNNMRRSNFRLITKMYDDVVIKQAKSSDSNNHIEQIARNIDLLKKYNFNIIDSYKNGKIYSKYMKDETYDKLIIKSIERKDVNKFYELIDNWYGYIKEKLLNTNESEINLEDDNVFDKNDIPAEKGLLSSMTFVKDGFIDLVFENTFFVDNSFIFYDQEWYFENVPLEYLLYRALNNIFAYNSSIEKIVSKENVLKHYDIQKYVDIFSSFEIVFQDYVIDNAVRKFYSNVYGRNLDNYIFNIRDKFNSKLNEHIIDSKSLIAQHEEEIKELNKHYTDQIDKLNKDLETIKNSRSWRYTKIFRKGN